MIVNFLQSIPKQRAVLLLSVLLIFCSSQFEAKGQLKKILQEGNDVINQLTVLTRSYKNLKGEANKNSDGYNKNVTVAKGNTGTNNPNPDNISKKKITKPKIKDNNFTNLIWEPANFFDGQLFPSAIISMASY